MRQKQHRDILCLLCLTAALVVLTPLTAVPADEYIYMPPEELKVRLDSGEPTILVDIQKKNAYKEHHFYGSVRTQAYPAKTALDTESLVQAVRLFERTGNDIVIIGPRGGRACRRTQDFLVSRGIPAERISILRGGIREWPHRDMLLNLKGGCG